MENYKWKGIGSDERRIYDKEEYSLTVKECLNVLVDNSWRPEGIEFNDIDTWNFNKEIDGNL